MPTALINHFSMAYTAAGQGRPLLFVHGYPLNREMWQPQVDFFAPRFQVLAPDLRGHGDSQPVPGPYSMDLFADDLAALLDALGVTGKVVLCGLSMGGYIAFAFYRKYASRLAGLVLIATRSAPDSPQAREARQGAAETARQQGVPAIVEGMLPKLLSPHTVQQRPALVEHARRFMLKTSLEGVLGDLAGLAERPDSTPTLASVAVPVLLLPGADDQIVPLTEALAMQQTLPAARLQVIPNAGHLPNLENPTAFNQALLEFLETL